MFLAMAKQTIIRRDCKIPLLLLVCLWAGCSGVAAKEAARLTALPAEADILFVSDRDTADRRTEIYALDIETGRTTRITRSREHHFIMGMDRSGRYIVTSRAVKDNKAPVGLGDEDRRSLWVLDLLTKKEKCLTDLKNHAEGDSFSPDGAWIVFCMKQGGEEQMDLYKIKRDGSSLTQLTDTKTVIEGDPAWSHDGRSIVYSSLDGLGKQRFVVKAMDPNGRNIRDVYDGGPGVVIPGAWPEGNYDPAWSPDDQWVVFERAVEADGGNFGSGKWHIFKVGIDGGTAEDLSLAGGHAGRAEYLPSYSPDGRSIVFGSIFKAPELKDSHNDIFMMDTEGASLRRLTHAPPRDMFPVFIRKGD